MTAQISAYGRPADQNNGKRYKHGYAPLGGNSAL